MTHIFTKIFYFTSVDTYINKKYNPFSKENILKLWFDLGVSIYLIKAKIHLRVVWVYE